MYLDAKTIVRSSFARLSMIVVIWIRTTIPSWYKNVLNNNIFFSHASYYPNNLLLYRPLYSLSLPFEMTRIMLPWKLARWFDYAIRKKTTDTNSIYTNFFSNLHHIIASFQFWKTGIGRFDLLVLYCWNARR